MPKAPDRAELADALRGYADDVSKGTTTVPALQLVVDDAGTRLRVVPRVLHDVMCPWRVATPQDTEPVVLGCAGCGLCYPRVQP